MCVCVCVYWGGGTGMNVSKQWYHLSWFNRKRSNPNTFPVLLFIYLCCKERVEHVLQQWHSHTQACTGHVPKRYAVEKPSFDNQAASLRVNMCLLIPQSSPTSSTFLPCMCFFLEFRFEEAYILDMTFPHKPN